MKEKDYKDLLIEKEQPGGEKNSFPFRGNQMNWTKYLTDST